MGGGRGERPLSILVSLDSGRSVPLGAVTVERAEQEDTESLQTASSTVAAEKIPYL